jgi:tryptophanyl-tRNA synthetase
MVKESSAEGSCSKSVSLLGEHLREEAQKSLIENNYSTNILPVKDSVIVTGDRPSGCLHLGHYVGSLSVRVLFQDSCQQYILIADLQALTDHAQEPEWITQHVYEVARDYLAVGIDPRKSTIFIQSQIPALTELSFYFMNLVTLGRLERNPTVKAEIQQKGYGDSLPAGFLCYPISQAADIAAFKGTCVPVGEDQIPMIEQTNEIVRKFNRMYKTDCLKEAKAYLSQQPRLVGTDGQGKASKTLGNAIFLKDCPEEIRRKVFSMYTDPNHIHLKDPGQVEGNVVFAYLDAFHVDKHEVESLKTRYRKGGLGDIAIKKELDKVLQDFLRPIREKRLDLSKDYIQSVLWEGTTKARHIAERTLEDVRSVLGMHYFKP